MQAAPNKISSSSVQVNEPLSDAEVDEIRANPQWLDLTVKLGRDAGDEAFASLGKISQVRFVEITNGNANITSFDPVKSLPRLVKFSVSRPKLNDGQPWSLRPFALIHLNLNRTLVSDVDSLGACTKLRALYLTDSGVTSLRCLSSMPALRELSFGDSKISIDSYEPVGSLGQLRQLSIHCPSTVDEASLSSLARLTQLRQFGCSITSIRNLGFLANCVAMERLDLPGNEQLENIDAIGNMEYLRSVYLSGAAVNDLSALSNKRYLDTLSVPETAVVDLTPLEHCTSLEKLDISETVVRDLAPLARKPYFVHLNMCDTSIDLETLPFLPQLEGVELRKSAISDVAPLAKQPSLKSLQLQGSVDVDLSSVEMLSGLEHLRISKDTFELA